MSTTAALACLFVGMVFSYLVSEVEHRVKRLRQDHDDLIKTVDDLQARVNELEDADAKRRRRERDDYGL